LGQAWCTARGTAGTCPWCLSAIVSISVTVWCCNGTVTEPGCEESEVAEIPHGKTRRKGHGGLYFFQCDDGGVMVGSSMVVCDGNNWDGIAPTCLRPAASPSLSLSVSGIPSSQAIAGSPVSVTCHSEGGHPKPVISLYKNQVLLGESHTLHNTATFLARPEDHLALLSCSALNAAMASPVTSTQVLTVHFAPQTVQLTAPSTVLSGAPLLLECVSSPSIPASSISWSVTQDHHILQPAHHATVEQMEDGSFITMSVLDMVAANGQEMIVECFASNVIMKGDSRAYAHVIQILSPPGQPKISGLIPYSTIQDLTCSAMSGSPPANLTWYKGQEVMFSNFMLEGDFVTSHIRIGLSENTEITCEALNEAVDVPIKGTVMIEIDSDSMGIDGYRLDESSGESEFIYDSDGENDNEIRMEDIDLVTLNHHTSENPQTEDESKQSPPDNLVMEDERENSAVNNLQFNTKKYVPSNLLKSIMNNSTSENKNLNKVTNAKTLSSTLNCSAGVSEYWSSVLISLFLLILVT